MGMLTIRELEELTGIKAHTIRAWEQRYDFIRPCRTKSNIRYYCNDELKLLQDVALLNKAGYRISRINEWNTAELREKASQLPEASLQLENGVNEMIAAMIDLDMDRFQDLIDNYSQENGPGRTIEELIHLFLVKSRLLWQTGHLNKASEMLAAHIIRQKLIVAIELSVPKITLDKTVLLFLPENDHKELGLLYSNYILKSRGYETLYLGDNVPLADLAHIVKQKSPGIIFTHLVNSEKPFRLDKYLSALKKELPGVEIIISGRPQPLPRSGGENISFVTEISEWLKETPTGVEPGGL